ncbi:MFS transporter (plasmid) [Acinetobacter sp. LoGeW2-3]|uniref:MFS transporter n=1 Tax=Acinetobacter sp. LoGeW2-3 TaxID=1808001 RepID=UPI000C05A125|nr:MFS transporter [Acinetobacter sp. LoGeW2-3]ATO21154.1 MFS transporter [Acinetobacter sp. LoGeW2-3]
MQVGNTVNSAPKQKWIAAFIFCFLVLLVDGADMLLLSYSLSSLKVEFGLSSFQAGMLGSVTLAGMAVGGIFGGWASDKFGRVRIISLSIIKFSLLTALLGFVSNVYEFAIVRFLSALGLGAVYMVCAGLMSELVPTKYRTTVIATIFTGWTFGYIVASLLAGAIIPEYGWRMLFIVSGSAVIIGILMPIFVKESEAWKKARLNRTQTEAKMVKGDRSVFKAIVQDKLIFRTLIFWMMVAGFMQFGYYGVNNWMPLYLEQELGMNFKSMTNYLIGSYTAMIGGKILAGYMGDKLGRKFTFMFGAITTAIFLIIIVMFHNASNILYLLVIFGFLYGMPLGVYTTYMSESFPTNVRGTAMGTAHNVGRIGSTIAPATIGFIATEGSIGLGFMVMGAAYLICALPTLFIKEKMYDPQANVASTDDETASVKTTGSLASNKAV